MQFRMAFRFMLAALSSIPLVDAAAQGAPKATAKRPVAPPILAGRVLGGDGRPVAGARVTLPQWGIGVLTDTAGAYRLAGAPSGLFIVRAEHPALGGAPARAVRLRAGRVARANFALSARDTAASCAAPTAVVSAAAASAGATAYADSSRLAWSPAEPVQGSIIDIELRTDSATDPTSVRGSFAGESLHFERASAGVVRAVGAIPVEAPESLGIEVVVRDASGERRLRRDVTVKAGGYRLERLRVAPRFGREPDSALAARMAAEGALAREASAQAHATRRLWREPFILPRSSRVTSGFGHGREFNGVVQSRHMGLDLAGAVGTPVRAANRGVVALVADFFLAGTAVYVNHGDGLVTGYFHLSRADVAIGDTVERGARIGLVGQTGRVTGPHLHWIARYGSVTADPRSLLGLEARSGPGEARECEP